MSIFLPDEQQQEAMSLAVFSLQSGKSVKYLQKLAKAGRIIGARQDLLTGKWWIYPPAKILKWWLI